MKKIISSNELFKILCVEVYDNNKESLTSYYELIEEPNRVVDVFDTLSVAEAVMQQKTEFWRSLIKRVPLYFEVRFIA
ncbi:MAG TPA: hypothetical protein VIM59_02670 [Cellvibrio sp.]